MKIHPTASDINNQLNDAATWADEGGSSLPGATYEQGVEAAIKWIIGDTKEFPIQELPESVEDDNA